MSRAERFGRPRIVYTYSPEQVRVAKEMWDNKATAKELMIVLDLKSRLHVYHVARKEGWEPRGKSKVREVRDRYVGAEELEKRILSGTVGIVAPGKKKHIPKAHHNKPDVNPREPEKCIHTCPGCGHKVAPAPAGYGVWYGGVGHLWHRQCLPPVIQL